MHARRLLAFLALACPVAAHGADDAYGDPIPAGAKLRLGTARLRNSFISPSAMTPDGRFLVSGSPDGRVVFTDPATGKAARTLRVEGVYGAPTAFSADGRRGLVGGYGQPQVIDAESGKALAKLTRPSPGGDSGAALSADGKRLAVGFARGFDEKDKDKPSTAVVWDVDANKEVASVSPVQNQTVYVALSGDGKVLATWGYHADRSGKEPPKPEDDPSRQVQFWDAATGKLLAKVAAGGDYSPSTVALSPDGAVAAVSIGDGALYLFETATGKPAGLLLGRARQGRKVAFSPDGKTVAAAGDDGYVQVWTAADGRRVATSRPPVPGTGAPRALQFVGNDRVVAWGNRVSAVVVWEAPSGKLISPAGGHANLVTGLAFPAGGKEFYTGDASGAVLRWDATTGKELGTLKLEDSASRGTVVLAPDGGRALCVESGGLGVYDLPAGGQQFVIPGDFNRSTRGAFTADGSRVVQVLTSYDPEKNPGQVAVWDVATGKRLGRLEMPGVSDLSAAVSPDGKTVVTAGVRRGEKGPGQFVVAGWELATGKKLGEFAEEYQGFGMTHVAAAGDGKSAVAVSPKEGAVVIDVVAGAKSRALDTAGKRVGTAPAVSPDGKLVAVATTPGFGPTPTYSVFVFEIATGAAKKKLDGLTGTPTVLGFSPDGKTLIVGSADTTALVWDVGG